MRARDNPFSADRVLTIRYRPQGWTWEELLTRLATLDHRAALVGPHGSGKTTLLEDLEPRLSGLGFRTRWLRLSSEFPTFPPADLDRFFAGVTGRDIVLFDGAEQLGPVAWWRFRRRCRRAAGLVITTHRAGRLPTLATCSTTPGLLQGIVADLLGEDAGVRADTDPEQLSNLFARHRGNLRDALRELYDRRARAAGLT